MLNIQSLLKNNKIKAFIGLLVVFVVLVFLLKTLKPESPKPEIIKRLPLVETQFIRRQAYSPIFDTIGQVKVDEMTVLSTKASGQVEKMLVEEGMSFKQGDQLIQISSMEFDRVVTQSQLQLDQQMALIDQETAQHQANLQLLTKEKQLSNLANKSLQRYQDLVKKKLATEAQLDQAREAAFRQATQLIQRQTSIDNWPKRFIQITSQAESLKAQLEQTLADAQTLMLKAPFDGQVASIMTAPGANVTPLSPLIHIYPSQGLGIQANIPGEINQALIEASDKANQQQITAKAIYLGQTHEFLMTHMTSSQSVMGARLGYFKPVDSISLPLHTTLSLSVILPPMENTYAVATSAIHRQEYIYLVNAENQLQRQAIQLIGETLIDDKRLSLIKIPSLQTNSDQPIQVVITQMVADVNGMDVKTHVNE